LWPNSRYSLYTAIIAMHYYNITAVQIQPCRADVIVIV